MKQLDTSIIISTYNSTDWLKKVLYGYNNQTYRQFEVVIADDGSNDETRQLLNRMEAEVFYPIVHVWHEDNGFQKSQILNKAIQQCNTEYIIMSDGDCIPRKDFVEQHVKYREEGYFLSGGYFMLPMNISEEITKEDIYTEKCFDVSWLKKNGLASSFKNNKLHSGPLKASFLNSLTPTNASWNGHNASGWKKDILAINGFDERMQYGGQDRELGERLINLGIKSKQIRYNAVVLHLDHPRGYKNEESIKKNLAIRKLTRDQKIKWTPYGIVKGASTTPYVSVIVSTYNQPEWLQKALWGFEQQLEKNFEVVIADDGSSQETKNLIDSFKENSSLNITHVWQEDHGFQKTKILNKAIIASNGEYLIFTDGDCIPRKDLVSTHLGLSRPGCFLSAGYFKLSMKISKQITKNDIETHRCFNAKWLLKHGLKKTFKINKLTSYGLKEDILNTFTPTSATWDGNNASGWRKDVLAVNGFDERMQYGGEDREMGERLMNYGIKPQQIRYSTVTLHLDHERGYVTKEMFVKNKAIRKVTKQEKLVWTEHGISKSANPESLSKQEILKN
ncbi:glycosyl transferase [Aequorivita sublithincola DSM 14238]|uniref:Glycosyl transferase n=1 Tax=Aequorivita sublithincola (strain DSM 14238 / LMG 21431 / ACAM 643 / 9-3) TaxID=746697 RepID=I3YXM0_AEQSU|nr:glycosyl transferase [Aequorivita sublithincola DSM 14238]